MRELNRDEGDDNQAHDHLFEIDKDLLLELDDVVLAVPQEQPLHEEEVHSPHGHHEDERDETYSQLDLEVLLLIEPATLLEEPLELEIQDKLPYHR
jgi:hypothetical protein